MDFWKYLISATSIIKVKTFNYNINLLGTFCHEIILWKEWFWFHDNCNSFIIHNLYDTGDNKMWTMLEWKERYQYLSFLEPFRRSATTNTIFIY